MDTIVRNAGDVDMGQLSGSLGFLLRLAQLRAFEDFFSDHGPGHAPSGLKPGEFSVLWVIAENRGIRQSVLGRGDDQAGAYAKLIRAMEDQGLVSRRIPDADRRAVD